LPPVPISAIAALSPGVALEGGLMWLRFSVPGGVAGR
jgi:hypothetical protein